MPEGKPGDLDRPGQFGFPQGGGISLEAEGNLYRVGRGDVNGEFGVDRIEKVLQILEQEP